MSRTKIVLYGHFGTGNIGNDSSFEAALTNFRRLRPDADLVCVCGGPQEISERFGIATLPIKSPRPMGQLWQGATAPMRWMRRIRRVFVEAESLLRCADWFRAAESFVVVGTGAVDDMAVGRPWDAPYDLLRWCSAARLGGARVVFLSVGVGPIAHPTSRRLMLTALRLAHVRTYREVAALDYLRSCAFDTRSDKLYPDLVFSLDMTTRRPLISRSGVEGVGLRVGLGLINYRGWRHDPVAGAPVFNAYMDKMKSFVRWLLERGYTVRLLVGDATDAPCLEEMLGFVESCGVPDASRRLIVEPILHADDLFAQIALTDIVVASRFHNVLCSLMLEKPVVSVGYHEKNDQLMAGMGMREFCQRIDDLDVERLEDQFDACVAQTAELLAGMRARLDALRGQLETQYRWLLLPNAAPAALSGLNSVGSAPAGLVPIVMASDENFAMPLATSLRSLVDANRQHWPLDVTILTDGFSGAGRHRVERSLPEGAANVKWRVIEASAYDGISMASHLSRMTFARLQLADSFAPDVGRAIYLDADTLVLGDLSDLSGFDLGDATLGAVADFHLDGALRRNAVCDPGVPRVDGYFNAGMLVIDLHRWRRLNIGTRALKYLAEHPTTPYSDQDALNVVCQGAWADVGDRWNFQNHHWTRIKRLPSDKTPAIVHFITAQKPWKPSSMSPNARLYDEYRDRTMFRRGALEKLRAEAESFMRRVHRKISRLHIFRRRLDRRVASRARREQ